MENVCEPLVQKSIKKTARNSWSEWNDKDNLDELALKALCHTGWWENHVMN